MAGLLRLWHDKFSPPPDPVDVSFEGKTVLITGGTAGLGFEASLKILQQGASVLIIGCRNLERGRLAKHNLEQHTGRTEVVQLWPLDMSSFESVQEFASRVDRELSVLHIALLNAGVLHRDYTLSQDGWEDTLQVNTLSTALLALLLLPKLRGTTSPQYQAHLTIVSSGTAARVTEKELPASHELLQSLNQPTGLRSRKRYPISKLLIEYVARSIADKTRDPNGTLQLVVNTVKPGFCVSSLGRQYDRWYERWATALFSSIFARSSEVGARVLVSATVQGAESHGRTWDGKGYMSETGTLLEANARGQQLQSKTWTEVADVLKGLSPELADYGIL